MSQEFSRRQWLQRTSVAALATSLGGITWAQSNNRPVRLIVAFAPGGPVDFVARTLAETLSRELGRPVLVDNKPGANGAIGAMETLKGEPDGSTVWITSVGAAAINQALYDKLPYDMVRDFTPVSLVVNNVEVLVTSAQNPATDVIDFVQRARAANAPVPMASSGMGSIPHLALLQMQDATKLDLLHVPFNGMAPALTNLLGGQVAGVFADVPAVMGQIKAGRLKALGMASRVRHPGLPEVRTFEEMGFPAVDTNNWYAFFVSARTPRPIVDALNAATRRALADPAVANRLLQSGAEPRATTPEEMAALLRADTNKWAALIKARNIRLDS
ncbi:Bug family tripartite tricarboxylate transporter substrate binding protein [Limnohabitans sp.]|uniref:Bug family tripartite tricarboxylate transporter substrate binding protein n=1 Tax=Limnohabitans sp. TaxID=1907725 RepID=UPI0039BC7A31|nr:tripartite tricarboxylate transporter substrate binding protein [Comamonadaceae bacterium]